MEISGKNTSLNLNAYVNNLNGANKSDSHSHKSETGEISNGDTVKLSSEAKEVQQAFNTLKTMPEIREEKVSEIKTQVDSGTYRIENGKIATNILNEAFMNNRIIGQFKTQA
jgi:negative regulator of flagellin synthesis FlgM